MIERLINKPNPIPSGLLVKKGSNRRSDVSASRPGPDSENTISSPYLFRPPLHQQRANSGDDATRAIAIFDDDLDASRTSTILGLAVANWRMH